MGSLMNPYPDPIGFISWDHERQLEICSGLEKLVSAQPAEPAAEWAVSLHSFLTEDLPLHVQDEELDLFPKLISRQPPASNLGEILEQLIAEHEVDEGLADLVIRDLARVATGASPGPGMGTHASLNSALWWRICHKRLRHWETR